MSELAEWDSFYVIVASSAGALIGLQFVVITLVAERPPDKLSEGNAAFSTPTVMHFSAVLLLAALVRAPWHGMTLPSVLWGLLGLCGLIYGAIVVRRLRSQTAYQPQGEDWLFHACLPLLAYALLAGSALFAQAHFRRALFVVGASALLLLFVGIHNAWDAASYHVANRRRGSGE